jgi:hypothetical protein
VSQLSAADKQAISEVIAAYCHCIDLGRWDELQTLFVDDCKLDFGKLMGVFEGRAGVKRFADTLAGIGLFMRHFTTNVVIRGDGDRARAESYVLAITGPSGGRAETTGRYEDEFVKDAGEWRIRVRRALLDAP